MTATQFSGHRCMDDPKTKRSFDSQATWIMYAMFSMGVCTSRHWQMSDRLVQELNVYTVQSTHTQLEAIRR